MPSLGADMDAGRLLEWYVQPGDAVHRGDIVALVDTDKAAIEVEIFDEGVVGELLIEPGTTVPVGTAMARIEAAGAARPAAAAASAPPPASPATVRPVSVPKPAPAPRRATPSARAHARELDLDLEDVRGTGRHGVVTGADVIAAGRLRERPIAEGAPEAAPAAPAPSVAPVPVPGDERTRLSPRARRLAEELGVDPSTLRGTGPDGTVTGDDVAAAAGAAATAPMPAAPDAPPRSEAPARPAGREKPGPERYAAMRRAIAAAMAKSKREIPHYYLTQPIDLERALRWLEERNLERSIAERVLPAALLLRATVQAIATVPEMNGFFREDGFEPSAAVHLGVGISLRQGGLIAPAILNAQDQDLSALMASIKDLVARTRTLQLRSSEMSEATITVTALGDQGVESVYGVIYPPQVALVGFGKVVARPWAVDGLLGVRRIVQATLAADHRASDGHTGGLFLAAIDERLQYPEEL